jgi:hypothetical protein
VTSLILYVLGMVMLFDYDQAQNDHHVVTSCFLSTLWPLVTAIMLFFMVLSVLRRKDV